MLYMSTSVNIIRFDLVLNANSPLIVSGGCSIGESNQRIEWAVLEQHDVGLSAGVQLVSP